MIIVLKGLSFLQAMTTKRRSATYKKRKSK